MLSGGFRRRPFRRGGIEKRGEPQRTRPGIRYKRGGRTMKVEIIKLKKHFGSTRAVNGVSFTFFSGQVVGFVGPNGAGKTTTMRILATLDEPTAGDALIDGVSVVEEPERARRLIG